MHENADLKLVAAIDVGSNLLRMIIAEIDRQGRIIPLEELKRSTNIGRDSYTEGKISVETIQDTCEGLKNFVKLMKDYQVKHYRAVATSGIREAENQEYILEHIRLNTGLEVEVINNAVERLLTYKAIRDHLPDAPQIREEGAVIVDIGSGGVEVSVYCQGNLQFTEYIRIGSLRLREILADLERMTLHFPEIMEEFIESKIKTIRQRIKKLGIHHFIGLGGEISTISALCVNEEEIRRKKFIDKNKLIQLYSKVQGMTTEQIIAEFQLDYKKAEVLLPSVILFHSILEMTEAQGINIPMVSLRHGLLADMVDRLLETTRKQDFVQDILSSVRYLAKKFDQNTSHIERVEKLALSIYDQIWQLHHFNERERFYLQIAAILHDIGKYMNLNNHEIHSYNMIRAQNIMGFSDEELGLIANIARYHSEDNPEKFHENYQSLSVRQKVIVSKLAAILKLADSLDTSQNEKIDAVEVRFNEEELTFTIYTLEDILLEKWSFENKIDFFEEVMGIKPVLSVKGEK